MLRWQVFLVPVFLLSLLAEIGIAKTLSKEEVEALWDQILREERYQEIYFYSRSSTPSVYATPGRTIAGVYWPPRIRVGDGRGGYLWGFFGLSYGGGWEVSGELEAEVPVEGAILQLYSKQTIKRSPGLDLIFLEPRYDPDKYPQWEFRLLLRHALRRQEIRVLKSRPLTPQELARPNNPKGELRYDPARRVAIMHIRGLEHPITVEVPIPAPPFPDAPRQ